MSALRSRFFSDILVPDTPIPCLRLIQFVVASRFKLDCTQSSDLHPNSQTNTLRKFQPLVGIPHRGLPYVEMYGRSTFQTIGNTGTTVAAN
jgi:hypothetical protein